MNDLYLDSEEKPNPFGFFPGASPFETWRAKSFPELRPIDFIGGQRGAFLNLLVPEFHQNFMDGHTERALVFACAVCARASCGLRLITLDGPCQPDFLREMMVDLSATLPEEVEFFDGSVRYTSDTYRRLVVGVGEVFVATDWVSARMARFLSLQERFVWIIQRDESELYPEGDRKRLVIDTFRTNDFLPVFSSPALMMRLVEKGWISEENEPLTFSSSRPSRGLQERDVETNGRQKRLWIESGAGYCPLLALEAVDSAIRQGILSTVDWRIFLHWEGRLPAFCDGGRAERAGAHDFLSKRAFLRTIDFGIFLGADGAEDPAAEVIRSSGGVVMAGMFSKEDDVVLGISRGISGEVPGAKKDDSTDRAVDQVAGLFECGNRNVCTS